MNKKVIIVEGCDRVGKDSLINELKKKFNSSVVIHASTPPKCDSLFNFYMDGFIHNTLDAFYNKKCDVIIHNRSMYGEYVYGPKYRCESSTDIESMIHKLEIGQLKTFLLSNELYFILLTSDNADLLVNNDDGNSISNKRNDIEYELNAFNEIFDKSFIKNKLRVYVNNGDKFRDKKEIFNEVSKFIFNK
jgi:hypothetical protein